VRVLHNRSGHSGRECFAFDRPRAAPIKNWGSYSIQQQSEVRVRGLEGLNLGVRSAFQARHLEMAEASKGHAEHVRTILHAIRDVNKMISEVAAGDDEATELEMSSYLDCKNDLLAQLAHARVNEKQRRRESPPTRGSEGGSNFCASNDEVH
jgi:hypothetical protein